MIPACLNIKSDLGRDGNQFLQELAAKGTLQKEKEEYSIKVTNYQELALTGEVLNRVGDLLETEGKGELMWTMMKDKKGSTWTTKKVFGCFIRVTLCDKERSLGHDSLYLPIYHN